MADVSAIVQRLEERLGELPRPPLPLDGGITNRNYRARFGERDYVVRLPGKDTALLGISRDAERIANAGRRRARDRARGRGRRRRLPRHGVRGLPADRRGAAAARARSRRRDALRAFHDSRPAAPDPLLGPGAARRLRGDRAPARRRAARRLRADALRSLAGSRSVLPLEPTRSRATTICCRRTCSRSRRRRA